MHPDNPMFEQWCLDQLDADDTEMEDSDPEYVIESDHSTDSEVSAGEKDDSEFTEPSVQPSSEAQEDFYYGREKANKTKWLVYIIYFFFM